MSKYEKLKKIIPDMVKKYGIKNVVAEIHNLYQEYIINEEQEEELYILADPNGLYNSPAEYWFGDCGCVDIWQLMEE